jgi:hypothetical protein
LGPFTLAISRCKNAVQFSSRCACRGCLKCAGLFVVKRTSSRQRLRGEHEIAVQKRSHKSHASMNPKTFVQFFHFLGGNEFYFEKPKKKQFYNFVYFCFYQPFPVYVSVRVYRHIFRANPTDPFYTCNCWLDQASPPVTSVRCFIVLAPILIIEIVLRYT